MALPDLDEVKAGLGRLKKAFLGSALLEGYQVLIESLLSPKESIKDSSRTSHNDRENDVESNLEAKVNALIIGPILTIIGLTSLLVAILVFIQGLIIFIDPPLIALFLKSLMAGAYYLGLALVMLFLGGNFISWVVKRNTLLIPANITYESYIRLTFIATLPTILGGSFYFLPLLSFFSLVGFGYSLYLIYLVSQELTKNDTDKLWRVVLTLSGGFIFGILLFGLIHASMLPGA
jgi:hypothetical protein